MACHKTSCQRACKDAETIDQALIGNTSCPFRGRHRIEYEVGRRQAESGPDKSAVSLNHHEIADVRGKEPKYRHEGNAPAANVQDLLVSESVAQTTPIPKGEKLGNGGGGGHGGKFDVSEFQVSQHVEGKVRRRECDAEVNGADKEDEFCEIRMGRPAQELPESEDLLG